MLKNKDGERMMVFTMKNTTFFLKAFFHYGKVDIIPIQYCLRQGNTFFVINF